MSAVREKLNNMPTSVVIALALGALAVGFALGAVWWWLAHHMAWWTYALLSPAWVLGSSLAKEVRKARQRRKARAQAALPAYMPMTGHTHRHGTSEPGWVEHSHLGGGVPHGHDPETGFQVPLTRAAGEGT